MKCSFRISVILSVLLLMPLAVMAETVSRKQAKAIAEMFFNEAYGRKMVEPEMVYNGRGLTTDRLFAPFYVYNHPVGGYVIVSAENKAFPILAYSLKDSFDKRVTGKKQKELLRSFARQIEYIRYDSRIPYEAIDAWNDVPRYVYGLLSAQYEATDPVFTMDEAADRVDMALVREDADAMLSDLYSSSQWNELVDEELKASKSVAMAILHDEMVIPFIVYGKKGDMYRIELDSRDSSLYRLFATEYLNNGQFAVFSNPEPLPDDFDEQPAFAFYDNFILETVTERQSERSAIEEVLMPTEPKVLWNGDGHFSVLLPEEIQIARVYDINGRMVLSRTFEDTRKAELDISFCTPGFYLALIYGNDGRPFGIKLAR